MAEYLDGSADVRCRDCGGDGTKFILRRGNPFLMSLPVLCKAVERVKCWRCDGTGQEPKRRKASVPSTEREHD